MIVLSVSVLLQQSSWQYKHTSDTVLKAFYTIATEMLKLINVDVENELRELEGVSTQNRNQLITYMY